MGVKAGRPFNTYETMKDSIEAAGFTNFKEKIYKVPIGTWAKHPIYKDAGRFNEEQFREGMEVSLQRSRREQPQEDLRGRHELNMRC